MRNRWKHFTNVLAALSIVSIGISTSFNHAVAASEVCQRALDPEFAQTEQAAARTYGDDDYAIVVAGYSSGGDIAPALAERGFKNVIHIHPSKELPSIAQAFSNAPYIENYFFDGDVSSLIRVLSGKRIRAVFAGTETGVELADLLSQRFGLPGNSTLLSKSRRNKWEMHQRLKEVGIASIRDIKTDKLDAILDWIKSPHGNNGQWPVVVKPLDSAGTQGVHICYNVEQVEQAYRSLINSKNLFGEPIREILAQEFLDGTEFVVNTVSRAGKHIIGEVWKYKKQKVERTGGSFSNIYLYDELLAFDSSEASALVPYALQVLEALGVEQGPGHLEIMMTKRGPVLVEMGARLMGGHSHLATRDAIGTSPLDLTLLAYLWPEKFDAVYAAGPLKRHKHVRNIALISHAEGQITGLNHVDAIKALPSFKLLDTKSIGDALVPTVDLLTAPGVVWLIHESEAVIERDYRLIREQYEPTLFSVR